MNIKLSEKDKIKVSEPEDIFGIMQRILLRDNKIDQEKEHFWTIGLNNGGYIVYIELISLGSATKTLVEPMNVFRVAILKGAIRIIVIHNHPSGTLKVSKEDDDITDRLIQVGKIISIRVDDHLIITPSSYISFREIGLMDKLELSLKYIPQYQLIEKIRQEEKTIRNEVKKELKETQQQVNKAISLLLDKGMSSDQISDMLGLSLKEVDKINKKRIKN